MKHNKKDMPHDLYYLFLKDNDNLKKIIVLAPHEKEIEAVRYKYFFELCDPNFYVENKILEKHLVNGGIVMSLQELIVNNWDYTYGQGRRKTNILGK